jgi:hypothetical protein
MRTMTMEHSRRFPRLRTRNLDRDVVMLPDDLPGPHDPLVVAFRRRQRVQAEPWQTAVAAAGWSDLGFWEVPVIGRAGTDRVVAVRVADGEVRC